MIVALSIKNFRGIAEGQVDQLVGTNVFVGPNNSGKSTILDALLLVGTQNPAEGQQLVMARRPMADTAKWLLYRENGKPAAEAMVEVATDEGRNRIVRVRGQYSGQSVHLTCSEHFPDLDRMEDLQKSLREVEKTGQATVVQVLRRELGQVNQRIQARQQRPQSIPGTPSVQLIEPYSSKQTPLTDLYTRAAEAGRRKEAKEIVTDLIPTVEDFEILTQGGSPGFYFDLRNGGALPVETAGDGVRLLLRLSFELATCMGGMVLLEEPETHLNPGAIRQAVRAMHVASRRGIQLVASTHSLDLIDSLLDEYRENLDSVAFFRTSLTEGKLECRRYSGSEAAMARTEMVEDLR